MLHPESALGLYYVQYTIVCLEALGVCERWGSHSRLKDYCVLK